MARKRLVEDCGHTTINLCGDVRKMVRQIQLKDEEEKKRLLGLPHYVEKILHEKAVEYFKKKKV